MNDELMNIYKHILVDGFYGFEFSEHWMFAIEDMLKKLDGFQNLKIFQIKEKFGRLRVYYETTNEEDISSIDNIIAYTEGVVDHVCYKCGIMKKELYIDNGGYLIFVCEDCKHN